MECKVTRKVWIAGLLLAAIGLGLAACGGDGGNKNGADTPQPDNTAPAESTAAQAESIYQANCLSCHGADLGGGFGPGLKNIRQRMSTDEVIAVIREGREQMPAFEGRLSDEEIRALAEWISAQ